MLVFEEPSYSLNHGWNSNAERLASLDARQCAYAEAATMVDPKGHAPGQDWKTCQKLYDHFMRCAKTAKMAREQEPKE